MAFLNQPFFVRRIIFPVCLADGLLVSLWIRPPIRLMFFDEHWYWGLLGRIFCINLEARMITCVLKGLSHVRESLLSYVFGCECKQTLVSFVRNRVDFSHKVNIQLNFNIGSARFKMWNFYHSIVSCTSAPNFLNGFKTNREGSSIIKESF